MLVTSQGWGLGGTSPFSRAWALCVTPVLLGDPLGPSHCLVARGANRAGSVSRNTRAPGAAPLCKMRGGGAGFPAVWGRLLPLCLSYGTLLSPAALPGSRKGWFPCGSFFSLVGKTQIFQARLSAAVALSQSGAPRHSHGRSRTKLSPWPAAVARAGADGGAEGLGHFPLEACARVHARTHTPVPPLGLPGSSRLCPLSPLSLPLHPFTSPSSPSFPPSLTPTLLSRPHEGSRERTGLRQVPAVILSFQEYTEATSGHAGSFLTTSHWGCWITEVFFACVCVR